MSKKNNSKDSPLLKALGIFLVLGVGLFLVLEFLSNADRVGYSRNKIINTSIIAFFVGGMTIIFIKIFNVLMRGANFIMIKSPLVLGKIPSLPFTSKYL